ncbi:hypothetical protein C0J52_14601 [Blattella germanica]|nr:hypothetical protein C0J52_14601 [Blattella germanica]
MFFQFGINIVAHINISDPQALRHLNPENNERISSSYSQQINYTEVNFKEDGSEPKEITSSKVDSPMLRSSQEKSKHNMIEKQQFPQLTSVARITRIPIVESGWNFATDFYSKLKLYEKSKGYVTSTFVQPVLKRADSVKQFGLSRANSAVLRFDNALDTADKYVDQYLPDIAPDENHEANNVGYTNNNKALQTFHRVDRFSRKLQRRLTQHTIAEVKAMRKYSEDLLRFVLYTAELVIYLVAEAADRK